MNGVTDTQNFLEEAEDEVEKHPLSLIMEQYLDDYDANRDENDHLSNLNFHKNYGLFINAPANWPHYLSIKNVTRRYPGKVVLIYGSTINYKQAHEVINDSVSYISWPEIYVAIDRVNEDTRPIKRIKQILSESNLTIFVGAASATPDVVDHVRSYCDKRLILLG